MSTAGRAGRIEFGGAAQSWAHHADLVMYARRVLGDRSDVAEDVVQEAYLRLLALAASDEAPTSARPWLFRVVRNLAIDERRAAGRRAAPVAEPGAMGAAHSDDTADLFERREELAGALRGLAALPPKERRALEMDQAGLGAQAIATELHTTPNAVHQALFRARRRLRAGKAVTWGLIPIGVVPLVLRLSDPALAITVTNLPPGMPVGRALPVAGVVAAVVVSGSVVAPTVHPRAADEPAVPELIKAAATGAGATADGATARSASLNRGSSPNSGPGSVDDDDDRSGPNRGSDDDPKGDRNGDRSGPNRGSDDDPKGDRSGPNRGSDDDAKSGTRTGTTSGSSGSNKGDGTSREDERKGSGSGTEDGGGDRDESGDD